MTQTFATNANNDIFINDSGLLQVDNGQMAVEDACATASKVRLGECVLQTGIGMPMFQAIFAGIPNPAVYENALRTTLEAVQGVISVTVIALTAQKNTFSYAATIKSEYGKEFTLNG